MNYASDVSIKQAAAYAGPATSPRDRPELIEQADRLHSAIDLLSQLLGQMGERLSPLIRPVPVAGGQTKPEAVRSLSPIGEQVCNATSRVEDLSYRVRSVLDALAV